MRLIGFLALTLIALAPATVYSFDDCSTLFAPQLEAGLNGQNSRQFLENNLLLNKNAQRSAATYRQNSNRDYKTYVQFFGKFFDLKMQALRGRGKWLDSGSGRALAPLEKAQELGIQVIPVSGQDFWSPLLSQVKTILAKRQKRLFRPLAKLTTTGYQGGFGKYIVKSVENLRSDDIAFAAHALGLKSEIFSGELLLRPKDMSEKDFDIELTAQLKEIDRRMVELTRDGLFQYTVGFSEKVIPTLKTQVDLITDLYGAYHYSVLRAHLLELYYASLTDSGTAYVLLGDESTWKKDVIRTETGDVPFIDYLLKTYPDNFSVTTSFHRGPFSRVPVKESILVMTKTPNLSELKLLFDFNPDEIEFTEARDGYKSATKIIYYPRRP